MGFNEKELVDGLQKGDSSVFDFLFRSYYPGLCSFAVSYLKSKDLSEELVQEVFVRFWEKHESISIHTSVRAYLYQSVFNGCMNHIRTTKAPGFRFIDVDDASIRNELMSMEMADSAFHLLFSEEAEKRLSEEIDELPDQCREIFLMCRRDNLSYKEISHRLSVSGSTVKTQMARAMNRLRKKMEKYF